MERRLCAILTADVVGYSRLIGLDEEGTLAAFKSLRTDYVEPLIAEHRGRVVKLMGDGFLVEFQSAVDAVKCAVAWQEGLAERHDAIALTFRLGVNIGDIVIDGDDILGDGVNVASRLEALAEPGGICISLSVRDQVRDKLDCALEDLGEVRVKNVARPVRVFRILTSADTAGGAGRRRWRDRIKPSLMAAVVVLVAAGVTGYWLGVRTSPFESASVARMAVPLPDRPSVAVLPFRDLSGDTAQRYFAEGVTEDVIADLSKVSGLLIVAYGSTRKYRDEDVSFRQVAEDLGVRYVLTGSIRRSGERLRATVQLVDAIRGEHIWGEKYDREVGDVFVVQSEIARQAVKAMAVTLKANEHDRLFQKQATSIDAYDAFLRARAKVAAPTRQNISEGEELFRSAIELDPSFAGAYAGLSFNYSVKSRFGFSDAPEEDARLSLEFAHKAVELDTGQAWSHIALAGALLANGRHDEAVEAARSALSLQPNGYEANLFMGFYLNFAGRSAEAVRYLEAANELSRIDTIRGLDFLAMAYFTDGQYANCEAFWLKRFRVFGIPSYPHAHVFLAASRRSRVRWRKPVRRSNASES